MIDHDEHASAECSQMYKALMILNQELGNPTLSWNDQKSNIFQAIVDYAIFEIKRLKEKINE